MTVARGGLKRLAGMYALVERMRAIELGVAAAAVAEVERAGRLEQGLVEEQEGAARAALQGGDRAELALASARREAARVRVQRLEEIQRAREALRDEAQDSYQASRITMEQVESAVERSQRLAEVEMGRREQAAMDDRYLSRRGWAREENPR